MIPVDSLLTRRRGRRRGGVLLELVLTIPVSIALIFLSIDVGRLVLVKSYLHDSAAVSARAAARTGDLGITRGPIEGIGLCAPTRRDDSNAYRAFCEAVRLIPGGEANWFKVELVDENGRVAPNVQFCQTGYLYVRVETKGTISYLTDVFANTAEIVNIQVPSLGDIAITASAVARCEVAY